MILKVVDKWLLVFTVLLLLLILILPQILAYSNILFLIIIGLVGIPHGALDHVIHFRNKSVSKMHTFNFYARYIALILVVCCCWYFFPLTTFGLFMAISAYHFGQSQLFYVKGPGVVRHVIFTLWGVFVLSSIIALNYHEGLAIIASLEWLNADEWMSVGLWTIITSASGLVLMAGFLYLWVHRHLTKQKLLFELFLLACLVLFSTFSNAVFTFSVYFGLWHSLRSLFIEYQSLNFAIKGYSLRNFLLNIFPFSFLAIIFLVISYYLAPYLWNDLSPYMLFIMFVSALTVPHLFIMHDLYENDQIKLQKS